MSDFITFFGLALVCLALITYSAARFASLLDRPRQKSFVRKS